MAIITFEAYFTPFFPKDSLCLAQKKKNNYAISRNLSIIFSLIFSFIKDNLRFNTTSYVFFSETFR